jgi:ABC-2 type transport system permease protein
MTDVIASEFLKVRTVRSTYALLAAVAAMMVLGMIVVFGMTADFDSSPPNQQALFGAADATVVVIPFAQFCLAALGALVITSEDGTGMIRPSLVAVPGRRTFVAAKAAVVAGVTLVLGQVVAFGTFFISKAIAGDRPAPLWPWESVADASGTVASLGLSVMVAGLVGLGIGLMVRSSAGAMVSVGALLFILPSAVYFLPSPWDDRVGSVMLPNLAHQLAGTSEEGLLSPLGALVAMVAYVVVAIGGGALALSRRDP